MLVRSNASLNVAWSCDSTIRKERVAVCRLSSNCSWRGRCTKKRYWDIRRNGFGRCDDYEMCGVKRVKDRMGDKGSEFKCWLVRNGNCVDIVFWMMMY